MDPDGSQAIAISGKMATDAGNGYQGLSIEGVAITVLATQLTGLDVSLPTASVKPFSGAGLTVNATSSLTGGNGHIAHA